MTGVERATLLHDIRAMTERLWAPANRSVDLATKREWYRQRNELFDRYYGSLPAVTFGRCPHCGQVASEPMDVAGLDGLWWLWDSPGVEMFATCDHFLTLLGGLHYQGHVPREALAEPQALVLSGPEVPFVVPRLLGLPGAACVLASIAVAGGRYRAYLASYFVNPPVSPERGHQPWLRESISWQDAEGRERWSAADDTFDFDVRSWIGTQPDRVLWIAPDDGGATLRKGLDGCPYLEVRGRRVPIEVSQRGLAGWPVPGSDSGAGS